MAWAEEGGASDQNGGSDSPTLALPAGGQVQVLDLMGRPVPSTSVALSPSPVYLLGPAGKAKILLKALKP